jgi:hypothetical protein
MHFLFLAFGAFLITFFLWADRGMFCAEGGGLGVILFTLWSIWGIHCFFLRGKETRETLQPWVIRVLLGFSLILITIDSKLLYIHVAADNLSLLSKGPIQIFPKTIAVYFTTILRTCVGLYFISIFARKKSLLQKWSAYLLLFFAALSHLIVFRMVPFPLIDVFTTISEATVALLDGKNPYMVTHFDLYQVSGVSPAPFIYLPGLFPWSVFGTFLVGDIRGGNFLALIGLALFFILSHSTMNLVDRFYLATLLFLGGASLFVAEQAWIDPILALLCLASGWCLKNGRVIWAGIFAGAMCATKQYGVVAFIFLFLMSINLSNLKQNWLRFLLSSLGVVLFVQIPFIIWNWQAYVSAAFIRVGQLPFRPDSYTLTSFFFAHGVPVPWMPIAGIFFTLLIAWRCWSSRIADLASIVLAISLSYMAIFLTNRHAFCNYYQLVYLLLISCIYLDSEGVAGCREKQLRRDVVL